VFHVASAPSDPALAHRLMTLGGRPGPLVRVVEKASGGARVIDLGGSRIAVSQTLARTLEVEA
jgi:Fe2+ transport system protein FeoA